MIAKRRLTLVLGLVFLSGCIGSKVNVVSKFQPHQDDRFRFSLSASVDVPEKAQGIILQTLKDAINA